MKRVETAFCLLALAFTALTAPAGKVGSTEELLKAIAAGERKIELRSGTYELARPIELGAVQSWLELTGGHGVRLTRARKIANGDCRPGASRCFYDHRWAVAARWPNEGWTTIEHKVTTGGIGRFGNASMEGGSFTVSPEVAERMAKWDFAHGDIHLAGYWTHDWYFETVKAASFDREKRLVTLAGPTLYGIDGENTFSHIGKRRFYAYNVRAELDAPGEWYCDRDTGKVEFVAPEGGVRELMVTENDAPFLVLRKASKVTLRGLDFEYAAGDGIVVADSTDVRIVNCRVHNVGGRGITINGGARCTVEDCEIAAVGRDGVSVSAGDRRTLTASGHLLRGNEIHDFGRVQRTYAPGVKLAGCGVSVIGNRIYDAPHTAIFYGGNEMLIESNEIYRVLQETADAGAVYSGRDPTSRGNYLRFNYIHDCGDMVNASAASRRNPATMAFYLDDCDCGDHYVSNRVENVPRGIMIGGGHDISVIGNSFSNCFLAISVDGRGLVWNHWDRADDPSWQFTRKVKEMPVESEPWRSRYPELLTYLAENPKAPRAITIRGNRFASCLRVIDHDWGITPALWSTFDTDL